ncbi:hypothetical protein [Pseudoalteromonas xiamenensis]|uniref:Uncharacterized protein n=1 Tax=Pseudoalteromonas xiamenensis TaxID=882626 RepID=A0A975DJU8_9GAMM|nr:hypothetical protein [Pseudoalteromonas xiamenensis]QTH73153.1 hypothetical protein J5O05_20325 [Pseudoalteromonas xiamenensis]
MQLSVVSGQHTYQLKPQPKVDRKVASSDPQPSQLDSYVRSNEKAIAMLDKGGFDGEKQAIYDQPSFKNGVAISAYKSIANEDRRNEIKQLIGVSVYA